MSNPPFVIQNSDTVQRRIRALLKANDPTFDASTRTSNDEDTLRVLAAQDATSANSPIASIPGLKPTADRSSGAQELLDAQPAPVLPPVPAAAPLAPTDALSPLTPPPQPQPQPKASHTATPSADEEEWRKIYFIAKNLAAQPGYRDIMEDAFNSNKLPEAGRRRYIKAREILGSGDTELSDVEPAEIQARIHLARIAGIRVSNAPHDYKVSVALSPDGSQYVNLGASRAVLEQRFYAQELQQMNVDQLTATPEQRQEAVINARKRADGAISSIAAAGRGVLYAPDESHEKSIDDFVASLPMGISGLVAHLSPQRMLEGGDVFTPDAQHAKTEGAWRYLTSISLFNYAAAGARTLREIAGWTDKETPLPIAVTAGLWGEKGLLDIVEQRHVQHVMDRTEFHTEFAEWAALPSYFYARLIDGVSHEEANIERDAVATSWMLRGAGAIGYLADLDILTVATLGGGKLIKAGDAAYQTYRAGQRVRDMERLSTKIDEIADQSPTLSAAMGRLEREDPVAYMLVRQHMLWEMSQRAEMPLDVAEVTDIADNTEKLFRRIQSDDTDAWKAIAEASAEGPIVFGPQAADPIKLVKKLQRATSDIKGLDDALALAQKESARLKAAEDDWSKLTVNQHKAAGDLAAVHKSLTPEEQALLPAARKARTKAKLLEEQIQANAKALKFNGTFIQAVNKQAELRKALSDVYAKHPGIPEFFAREDDLGRATAELATFTNAFPIDIATMRKAQATIEKRALAARDKRAAAVEAMRKEWGNTYLRLSLDDPKTLDAVAAATKIERTELRELTGAGADIYRKETVYSKGAEAARTLANNARRVEQLNIALGWRESMKATGRIMVDGMRTARERGTMPTFWAKHNGSTMRVSEQLLRTPSVDWSDPASKITADIHDSLRAQGVADASLFGVDDIAAKLRKSKADGADELASWLETGILPSPNWRANIAMLNKALVELTEHASASAHLSENMALTYLLGKLEGTNKVPKVFRLLRDYVHKTIQDPTLGRTGRMSAHGQQAVRLAENSINRTMEELSHAVKTAYKEGAEKVVPAMLRYMDSTDPIVTKIGPTAMNNVGGNTIYATAREEIIRMWEGRKLEQDGILDGLSRIWTVGLSAEQAAAFRHTMFATIQTEETFEGFMAAMRKATAGLQGSSAVDLREGRVTVLAARHLVHAIGLRTARHVLESADLPLTAERAHDMSRMLNAPHAAFRFKDFHRTLQDLLRWELSIAQRSEDVPVSVLNTVNVEKLPSHIGADTYIPRTVLHAINENLEGAVKELDTFQHPSANTAYAKVAAGIRATWAVYKSDMVLGIVIPKAQYFMYSALGDMGQMWFSGQGALSGLKMAPYQMLSYMPGGGRILAKLGKKNLPVLGGLIDPDTAKVLAPETNPDDIVNIGGKDYKVHELRRAAALHGVTDSMAESAIQTEVSRLASYVVEPKNATEAAARNARRAAATINYFGREAKYLATLTQHRTRMAYFLMQLREGKTIEEAGKATNDALFDWAHGVSRTSVIAALGAVPFFRWWNLAYRHVVTQMAHFAQRPSLTNGPWQKVHTFSTLYNDMLPDAMERAMGEQDYNEYQAYANAWRPDHHKGSRAATNPRAFSHAEQDRLRELNAGVNYTHWGGLLPGMTQMDVLGLTMTPMMGVLAVLAEALGEGDAAANILAQMIDPFVDQLGPGFKEITQDALSGTVYPEQYRGSQNLVSISEAEAAAWFSPWSPLEGAPEYLRDPETGRAKISYSQYVLLKSTPIIGITVPKLLDNLHYKNPYSRDTMGKAAAWFLGNYLGMVKTTVYDPSVQQRRAIRDMEQWIKKEETRAEADLKKLIQKQAQ